MNFTHDPSCSSVRPWPENDLSLEGVARFGLHSLLCSFAFLGLQCLLMLAEGPGTYAPRGSDLGSDTHEAMAHEAVTYIGMVGNVKQHLGSGCSRPWRTKQHLELGCCRSAT
eukprot:1155443-Pelagomonas_calceolata.AAC.4